MEFKLSTYNLSEVFSKIGMHLKPDKKYKITVTEHKKRSLDANAQAHVWCSLISQHTGDDIKTVTLRNKIDFGLPIFFSSDSEMAVTVSWMLSKLNFYNMRESQQFRVIDTVGVTRHFTPAQHSEFRENMRSYWEDNGIILPYIR